MFTDFLTYGASFVTKKKKILINNFFFFLFSQNGRRAACDSSAGRMRPAGRQLAIPDLTKINSHINTRYSMFIIT